jgi:hypothetical protein
MQLPINYHNYILRIWNEGIEKPEGLTIWRFSIYDPLTGVVKGFANLPELVAYLRDMIARQEETGPSNK